MKRASSTHSERLSEREIFAHFGSEMRVEPDVISAWSHLVLTLSFSDKHTQTSSDLAKLHEDQMQRHKNANGEDHEKCGVKTRRVSSRVTN